MAIVIVCGGGGEKKSSVTAAQICAATQQPAVTIDSPDIIEASGIAASRRNESVLWLHNDSGDTARVFAVDRQGRPLLTADIPGDAVDWEDMAIGPWLEEGDHLFLADIGDNGAVRADVAVFVVFEPELTLHPVTSKPDGSHKSHKLILRYPDHPHDAETFMVDPDNGDMYIVTKELAGNISSVFRAPKRNDGMLDKVGEVNFGELRLAATPGPDAPTLVRALPLVPTGGEISPDGSLIAIRTYGSVWVWSRAEGESVADALAGQPCEAPSAIEQQGEAIAFDADGKGYVTISEGSSPPLHHFVVK